MLRAITKKEITPQPVLVVQRRVKPSEVAQILAQVLGRVFAYAQRRGIPLAGQPLTRYLEWGPGVWTIEPGMGIGASPLEPITDPEIKAGTLPGGLVATTTREGTYETLLQTHGVVQQWLEAQGLTRTGAPGKSTPPIPPTILILRIGRPMSSGLWRAMSNAKRSTVTLHLVSSLDDFTAKKDDSVSWMDSSDVYERGLQKTALRSSSG